MLNKNQDKIYVVSTWYDVVTPESAEEGDFSETGVAYHENEYASWNDAIEAVFAHCGCLEHDDYTDEMTSVNAGGRGMFYAADPVINDYGDSSERKYAACTEIKK